MQVQNHNKHSFNSNKISLWRLIEILISLNIRGICVPMVQRMSNLRKHLRYSIRNCLKIALDNTERLLICRLLITI
ncbi:hypothetical protein T06_14085 [Trichinella sp. T6]|nr:hypothetical protein T06_14085 [Trichinella sp. T6]